MKVKKINVEPIPAEVKEMKFNASTPRQEALRLQKQNTKEQLALIKAHHGGKGKLHTVPQFHTGAPCISGKCGNHSSVVANKNIMTSKKNSVYDSDVISADKMSDFMKKGGRKYGKKSRKVTRKKKRKPNQNTKKTKKHTKKSKRLRKKVKGKTHSRKSK
jgi:hypothetical protein